MEKKISVTVVLFLLVFCTAMSVKSQELALQKLFDIDVTAENMSNTAAASRAVSDYHYGVILNYFPNNATWWTGIAVLNGTRNNTFWLKVFNESGQFVAAGEWTLPPHYMHTGAINNIINTGTLPGKGYIAIFAHEYFDATMFIGSSAGGFGFSEKVSLKFQ